MRTANDFFLPDAHFVVHQTMSFHLIAEMNQAVAQLLENVLLDESLGRRGSLARPEHGLGRLLLLLKS